MSGLAEIPGAHSSTVSDEKSGEDTEEQRKARLADYIDQLHAGMQPRRSSSWTKRPSSPFRMPSAHGSHSSSLPEELEYLGPTRGKNFYAPDPEDDYKSDQ